MSATPVMSKPNKTITVGVTWIQVTNVNKESTTLRTGNSRIDNVIWTRAALRIFRFRWLKIEPGVERRNKVTTVVDVLSPQIPFAGSTK